MNPALQLPAGFDYLLLPRFSRIGWQANTEAKAARAAVEVPCRLRSSCATSPRPTRPSSR
jgi:hypothetical protein